jgi:DNA mismatch repair protein MutS2
MMDNMTADERAQVKSSSSSELSKIRAKLQKSRMAANRIFDRALKKYRDKGLIADFNESVSENRRVLAIQSSFKGQVNGILHGSSAKHSITYIEPGETVEINNEITFLQDEEKQEILGILRELSDLIRPEYTTLGDYEKKLTKLDFLKAKALFAHAEGCCLPQINNQSRIYLKEAYNPALKIVNRVKGKTTIPLILELNEASRILVISGPNAGGKSIALKTLGLLQLMLQSGFLVPVHPDSSFQLFQRLMGDIGDSQSIENELSTYSSKLEKMKYFLHKSDDQTLLLIDEFGSGSDPDLGSALAQVFLERLNSFKTFGILTTHYNAIKAIAASTEGILNGAMLFDRKTFNPEYKLEVGNPGSSYTFEVAEKSGIPSHLIKEARQRVGKSTLNVDRLLVQIQDEKLQLEKKRDRLNEELVSVKRLEAEKASTIEKLEEKLSKQSKLNEENDRIMYWGQRFQKLVDSWMDQQSQKDKKAVVARFVGMLNQRSGETEKEEKKELTKAGKRRKRVLEKLIEQPLQVGDKVKVLESKMEGTIQEIKGDRYKIVVGDAFSVNLSRDKIIPATAKLEAVPKARQRNKSFQKNDGASKSISTKAKSKTAPKKEEKSKQPAKKKPTPDDQLKKPDDKS